MDGVHILLPLSQHHFFFPRRLFAAPPAADRKEKKTEAHGRNFRALIFRVDDQRKGLNGSSVGREPWK